MLVVKMTFYQRYKFNKKNDSGQVNLTEYLIFFSAFYSHTFTKVIITGPMLLPWVDRITTSNNCCLSSLVSTNLSKTFHDHKSLHFLASYISNSSLVARITFTSQQKNQRIRFMWVDLFITTKTLFRVSRNFSSLELGWN